MTINQSFDRIDTLRIKESILERVGGTRFETYTTLLRKLFSGSVSAVEFHRLCIQTIGGENLNLHNELIKGILRNVCPAGAGLASWKRNPGSSGKVRGKRGRKPKAMPLNDENGLIGSSDDVKPKRGRKRKDPASGDLSLANAKPLAGRKRKDPPLNDSNLAKAKTPARRKQKEPPPSDGSLSRAKTQAGLKCKDQPRGDSSLASAESPAGLIIGKDPPLNDSCLANTKTPGRLKQNDQPLNDASITSTKASAVPNWKDRPSTGMRLTSSSDAKTPDVCEGSIPPANIWLSSSPRKARTTIYTSRFKKCASLVVPGTESESISPAKVPITPEDPCIGSRRPAVESSEDAEQIAATPGVLSVSPPITAPFGISNNLFGLSKAKAPCSTSLLECKIETCLVKHELPDSFSLMNRLDRMLRMEGMNVSVDGANLLNKALDLYLKRLIKPITDLSGTRSPASLLDFNTAMALNPRVLGEYWPSHLERISVAAYNL